MYTFSQDDPFCGIDLDEVLDPTTGEIKPWAAEAIARLDSYTELAPSGVGFHIIAKGALPGGGHNDQKAGREMYDRWRYFTVTGKHWLGTPTEVKDRQDRVTELYNEWWPNGNGAREGKPQNQRKGNGAFTQSDQEVIDRAKGAKNGGKLAALFYGGSWQSQGYPSQSEADAALCSMLAFWTQDLGQIDRIFRQSALMRRKWDEVHHSDGRTYGQATIQRTLNIVGKPYQHNRQVWREAQGNESVDPLPWPDEDPPVEAYADDPEAQGQSSERAAKETQIIDIGKAVRSFKDLLTEQIPDRKRLLPWLPEGGLCMISAQRGLGKTFFGLSLAHSLTSGHPFMRWNVSEPAGVLYIDGEMAMGETRERLQGLIFEEPKAPLLLLSHEIYFKSFESDLVLTKG